MALTGEWVLGEQGCHLDSRPTFPAGGGSIMSYPYGLMELIPEMRGEGEGIADYVEGNSGVSGGALQSQRQKK